MANVPGYNTPNARLQDGSWEIQGTLNIDKANGGVLTVDGTDVSAGLEELANLNGLSSTEVGFIDGAVAGTNTASKALVVNSAKHVDVLKTASLELGASGATTAVTATAAELNEIDDITSLAQSTIAVAAESGDAIAVTVTLKDAAGVAVDEARVVNCWLSSSATTGAVASDDTITVTATTGSFLVEHTDDLIFKCVTNTSGVLVLSVAHAGDASAKYLWVEFPNGKCKVSAVIDLAA